MRTPRVDLQDYHESDGATALLSKLLAAGYLRLLAARGNDGSPQKRLDVAGENEAPLGKRVPRRKKLA